MDLLSTAIAAGSVSPFFVLYRFKKIIYFEFAALAVIGLHAIILFGPSLLLLLLITLIISTIAELVSLKTPFNIFGVRYRYQLTNPFFSSKINILGVYPLEIAFAWVILKYISFCLGILIVLVLSLPNGTEILLVPLVLVSLDFIIDPIAVHKMGLWSWEKGSWYFGIPLRNFLGWFTVGLSAVLLSKFSYTQRLEINTYLYILPIVCYASILINVPSLAKKNKTHALFGAFPSLVWFVVSFAGLLILS